MTAYTDGQRRADIQLRDSVRRVLNDRLELEEHPVEVVACEGVVQLGGTLPSADLREFAESQAMAAEGVARVINRIQVDGSRA
jgi:osmotically-inducible protein OsmY